MSNSEVKTAVILAIEVVLMRKGGGGYHTLLAKLNSLYDYELSDCYENPEILVKILRQVFENETERIIQDIEIELTEYLEQKEVQDFLNELKNKK